MNLRSSPLGGFGYTHELLYLHISFWSGKTSTWITTGHLHWQQTRFSGVAFLPAGLAVDAASSLCCGAIRQQASRIGIAGLAFRWRHWGALLHQAPWFWCKLSGSLGNIYRSALSLVGKHIGFSVSFPESWGHCRNAAGHIHHGEFCGRCGRDARRKVLWNPRTTEGLIVLRFTVSDLYCNYIR